MEIGTYPAILLLSEKKTRKCITEFKRGQFRRKHSNYNEMSIRVKLYESLSAINDYRTEIKLLSAKYRSNKPLIGFHTYGDHEEWILNLPLSISFDFGWRVYPAIDYIKNHISNNHVNSTVKLEEISNKILLLIKDCQLKHDNLKNYITDEYQRWKIGYSILDTVLNEAEALINRALTIHDEFY